MRDLALIAADIDQTRQALARENLGRPVYRSTPGCTRGCDRCDIRCAILTGELDDLHNEMEAAIRAGMRAGIFYVAEAGTA